MTAHRRSTHEQCVVGATIHSDNAFSINSHGVATVVSCTGRCVWGVLWKVTKADAAMLDVLREYLRIAVNDKIGFPKRRSRSMARNRQWRRRQRNGPTFV